MHGRVIRERGPGRGCTAYRHRMALRDYLAGEVAEDYGSGFVSRREALRRLGLLGVGLGVGGAPLMSKATGWETTVTPWAIGLSLTISMLTGIIFGLYPARRAAYMDPIEALRHE